MHDVFAIWNWYPQDQYQAGKVTPPGKEDPSRFRTRSFSFADDGNPENDLGGLLKKQLVATQSSMMFLLSGTGIHKTNIKREK